METNARSVEACLCKEKDPLDASTVCQFLKARGLTCMMCELSAHSCMPTWGSGRPSCHDDQDQGRINEAQQKGAFIFSWQPHRYTVDVIAMRL